MSLRDEILKVRSETDKASRMEGQKPSFSYGDKITGTAIFGRKEVEFLRSDYVIRKTVEQFMQEEFGVSAVVMRRVMSKPKRAEYIITPECVVSEPPYLAFRYSPRETLAGMITLQGESLFLRGLPILTPKNFAKKPWNNVEDVRGMLFSTQDRSNLDTLDVIASPITPDSVESLLIVGLTNPNLNLLQPAGVS